MLPIFELLKEKFGLDPESLIATEPMSPWLLDEAYPPSLGELLGSLGGGDGADGA